MAGGILHTETGLLFRFESCCVYRDDSVGMLGIWFYGGVSKSHGHERSGGGVTVLQALKEGAAKAILGVLGDSANRYAIALYYEISQTTFKISFGIPSEYVSFQLKIVGGGGGD